MSDNDLKSAVNKAYVAVNRQQETARRRGSRHRLAFFQIVLVGLAVFASWELYVLSGKDLRKTVDEASFELLIESDALVHDVYQERGELPLQHPSPVLATTIDYQRISDTDFSLETRFTNKPIVLRRNVTELLSPVELRQLILDN
ncbi:MAG: hypothetical protein R3202_10180 [Candidatus Competibacterales bacterium]|nr:hypothetical protein [Candidatus Competibacterales bacterium]